MANKLTPEDLDLIARAREVGPSLRAGSSDRDRLAGWLLKELADLAERLATVAGGPCWCGHAKHVHNVVGQAGGRGFCTECEPGRCGRYEAAK